MSEKPTWGTLPLFFKNGNVPRVKGQPWVRYRIFAKSAKATFLPLGRYHLLFPKTQPGVRYRFYFGKTNGNVPKIGGGTMRGGVTIYMYRHLPATRTKHHWTPSQMRGPYQTLYVIYDIW